MPYLRLSFQSTHPIRGATQRWTLDGVADQAFQSTHPIRGATVDAHGVINSRYVSIHAPHTGCDLGRAARKSGQENVSIHAPHTGCDRSAERRLAKAFSFQSTHPIRGATLSSFLFLSYFFWFQSTHPIRGATPDCSSWSSRKTVSIHAPHTGCDMRSNPFGISAPGFNPRTPYGVRLKVD